MFNDEVANAILDNFTEDELENIINNDSNELRRRAAEIALEYREAQSRSGETEKAGAADEVKFDIRQDENGTYINIDKDILAGVPESEYRRTVKEFLKKNFPSINVNGQKVIVNNASRGEFTNSKYGRMLESNEPDVYTDKMRMANNLDEIVQNQDNIRGSAAKHPRHDRIVRFDEGDVRVKVGNKMYTAKVQIGVWDDGTNVFHDILNIKDTGAVPSVSSFKTNNTGRNQPSVSGNSVSQTPSVVNTQNENSSPNGQTNTNPNLLTEEQRAAVEQLARACGVKVEIVPTLPLRNGSGANGKYVRGERTIYLAEDADRPIFDIFCHEVTHYLKTASAESFSHYCKAVMEILVKEQALDGETADETRARLVRQVREAYAAAGQELGYAAAMEELAADFTGRLMDSPEEVYRMINEAQSLNEQQKRGVIRRIIDAIDRLVKRINAYIKNTGSDPAPAELTRLDRTRQALVELLAAGEENGAAANKNGPDRYSFAGERARTADRAALDRARQMESRGSHPETIWEETGWGRGLDGKWRYEIDDSAMNYDAGGNIGASDDLRRVQEIEGKMDKSIKNNEAPISDEEFDELLRLLEKTKNERHSRYVSRTLGDYLGHTELFEAYPELGEVRVRMRPDLAPGEYGNYDPDTNTININASIGARNQAETMLHEVQHAIQSREGFAEGASSEYWNARQSSAQWAQATERIQNEIDGLRELLASDPNAEDADLIRGNIDELEDKLNSLSFELYQNTAGEIEARDAASRRNMTAEERRWSFPESMRPNDNAVFAGDGTSSSVVDIKGNNGDYGTGVYLDTNLLDKVHPRNWGKFLTKYVYDHLAGKSVEVFDENGNAEEITFAKKNERVSKDGNDASRKVIDKLARTKGNINTLSIIHIDELLQTAKKFENSTDNSHKWLDQNGWEYRKAYVQDIKGNIFETTLNIAKARDGRNILYALSNTKKVDEGVVPSTQNGRGSHTNRQLSDNSISNSGPAVNTQNENSEEKFSLRRGAYDRERYDGYSIDDVKKYMRIGQQLAAKEREWRKAGYDRSQIEHKRDQEITKHPYRAEPLIEMGWDYADFDVDSLEEKTYYRIGEPAVDSYGNEYRPSYNHAEDMREHGVSVATGAWLRSGKSVFFGTSDEKIARRGVYKITGIELPYSGGDDEILIYPTGWAERTNIKTRLGLERAVNRLERAQSEAARADTSEGTRLSLKKGDYDYTKPFAQQVDDWKQGLIPQNDSLVVGATPETFVKVGFNSLPMTINQTHVDYAVNGTRDKDHYIGEAMLKQLPQKLADPVAIITSQTQTGTSVVALLDFVHNGKTVIAPVVIDGLGRQNSIVIDSNAITSVFAKGSAITKLLSDAINDETNNKVGVYYLNTKKAPALLQVAGLQLPGGLFLNGGFIHSITDPGSPVKPKLKNVTQSQQFKRWFGDWEKTPHTASKVVNDDGTPKVVYHGTDGDFTVFDPTKGRSGMNIQGAFFSPWEIDAQGYGKNVGAYYLNIRNPAPEAVAYRALNKFAGQKDAGIKAREYLESLGYDGVNNGDEEYIAFHSNQIKSATDNIGTFDPDNGDIRYSLKGGTDMFRADDAAAEKYAGQIDNWLRGEMPSNGVFELGKTPGIFQRLGARNLPVIMPQEVIAKITGGKHDISLDEIKKLPSALADPLMIFNSATVPGAFVTLTELRDKSGNSVVAALHLNRFEKHFRVNRIASVYGKENVKNFIEREAETGNLKYINKEKSEIWSQSRGLQLPKLADTITRSNSSILQKSDFVNTQNENSDDIRYSVKADMAKEGYDPDKISVDDMWNWLFAKYGKADKGEIPARDVAVPKKTAADRPVSLFARTMMEAGITPDWAVSEFEQAIIDGTLTHEVITDDSARRRAEDSEAIGYPLRSGQAAVYKSATGISVGAVSQYGLVHWLEVKASVTEDDPRPAGLYYNYETAEPGPNGEPAKKINRKLILTTDYQ